MTKTIELSKEELDLILFSLDALREATTESQWVDDLDAELSKIDSLEDRFKKLKNEADLASAAPELLEAVEFLVEFCGYRQYNRNDKDINKVWLAISKAKGETK